MNHDTNSKKDKAGKPNRDPITKAPGSHPVGTGAGAAAGGAAGIGAAAATGAAVGTAAGPVGTGIGAAAGAVVGGLGGKAIAEHVNPTGADLQRYLDYTVVDRNGDKVGNVDAVWQDHTGQPAYVGIKTGWLGMGRAHVVPAQSLDVSDATRKIRLPYTSDVVKNAPAFDEQAEIDDDAERRIADYYRGHGLRQESRLTDEVAPTIERREWTDSPTRRDESMVGRDEDVRVPLSEEEVKVGKREVEYGGVRLRKVIRTETVNQPVELQREEIVVERMPASQMPSRSDVAFREEEIYVPLRREEPVVEKTAHTREEVRVGKRRESEHREINETVRREDVEIDRDAGTRDSKGR